MIDASQIQPHMEVVGSDGQHVGTVDHMDGNRVKLAKKDPAAQGEHHYLSMDMIDRVDGGKLCLKQSSQDVTKRWQQG